MEQLAQDILHRLSQLSKDKGTMVTRWQEIAEYLQPERADFTGTKQSKKDDRLKIFDSTPEDAVQILAAALHSFLTPSVHAWLNLALVGDDDEMDEESKRWLDDVKRKMMAKFNNEESGFHSAVHEFYLDLPSFGTSPFFVDEVEQKIRFSCIPLSEVTISENHMGMVDTIYREFEMSARQIAERWPSKIPQCVKESLEKNPDRKFVIVHAIYPRKMQGLKKKKVILPKDMPFASCYLEKSSKELLSESGYQEMPMMVARWSKVSGESYGRGPGQRALPDIRVLNEMNRSALIAGERQAAPPLFLPHDGFIGDVSTDGDATNYYRSTGSIHDKVMFLESRADLNAMMSMIAQRQDSIRKIFLNDKLQMVGGPQMTATEVIATQNEKMRILGPVLGRLQSEFLSPLVSRVFGIMMRNGEFDQVPEGLQGKEIKVEYVSPISRAQKQTEAEAFTQTINFLAPLVQMRPDILENFDFNAVARDTVELYGYPNKYLKSLDTMKKEAEARAQAQAQAQQKQNLADGITLAKEAKGLQTDGQANQ